MVLNQHTKKPQFRLKIAQAFLVILCCAVAPAVFAATEFYPPNPVRTAISDFIGFAQDASRGAQWIPRQFAEGAQAAVSEVIPALFSPASLASVFGDIKCFFGFGCSIAPAETAANPEPQSKSEAASPKNIAEIRSPQENSISPEKTGAPAPADEKQFTQAEVDSMMTASVQRPQIIQNINPAKEIQTIHTITNNTNTNAVIVDQETKSQVARLLRQLDTDRLNYSAGQNFTMPANLGGTTLNIGGNFLVDNAGAASAGSLNIGSGFAVTPAGNVTAQAVIAESDLTVQGNFTVSGTQVFTGASTFNSTGTFAGNVGIGTTSPVEALDLNGRLRLAQTTAPDTVADKLYNVGGSLYWNGATLALGSSVSGTLGYLPKFISGTSLGNSALFESGGNVGIGTTGPLFKLDVFGSMNVTATSTFAGRVGIGTTAPV